MSSEPKVRPGDGATMLLGCFPAEDWSDWVAQHRVTLLKGTQSSISDQA